MILRDLVTRISFKVDTAPLKKLDNSLGGIKKKIVAVAGTALSGWAIKSGSNIEILKEQFKALDEKGISPLRKAITELAADRKKLDEFGKPVTMASIFKESDLLKAGVGLKQLGFEGEEAAAILKFAGLNVIKFGGDIGGAVEKLSSGIMEGGITGTLRGMGLLTKETENALSILESKISSSSGEMAGIATRNLRKEIFGVMRSGTGEFEKDFAKFLETPAASAMRLASQAGSLWDDVTSGIIRAIKPALDWISKILSEARDLVKIFTDIANIKIPTSIKDVTDSIGLTTKKPDARKEFRVEEVTPPEEFLLEETTPSIKTKAKDTFEEAAPSIGVGAKDAVGSTTTNGDINISVVVSTQASDPVAVAKEVSDTLTKELRKVGHNFIPQLEATA